MTLRHYDFEAQTREEALSQANAWLAGAGRTARLVNIESAGRDGACLRVWYMGGDLEDNTGALQPQSQPFENALRREELFAHAVVARCGLVRTMSGATPQVTSSPTQFVLDGAVIDLRGSDSPAYSFWLGLNHRRMFWIANVECDSQRAEDVYQWCFGGAAKIGWATSFQPFNGGTSVWSTCLSSDDLFDPTGVRLSGHGEFWATDIAMMVQSWLRTSEREKIACSEIQPSPL